MVIERVEKAVLLLKLVHKIKDILNRQPDFFKSTKDLNYSYHIKIVDNKNDEITKFSS